MIDKEKTDLSVSKDYEKAESTETKEIFVTSDTNIDFPELNWGINKGEVRALPVEEESRKRILENYHLKIK